MIDYRSRGAGRYAFRATLGVVHSTVRRIERGDRQHRLDLERADLSCFCDGLRAVLDGSEKTVVIASRSGSAAVELGLPANHDEAGFTRLFGEDRARFTISGEALDYMEHFVAEGLGGAPFPVDHADFEFDPPSNDRVTSGAWILTVHVPPPYGEGLSRDELFRFLDGV